MVEAVYLERSPAKINLFLKVLDKREDGFHNIETLFQALELSDHLTFKIDFEKGQSEFLDFSLEIDSNSEEIKSLAEKNIIAKAIELYFSELEDTVLNDIKLIHFKIFVDKQIPLEAGLAGGSANAAATLRMLNKFFEEYFSFKLDENILLRLALKLGSDVPFCLLSTKNPRLYAESRGEIFKEKVFDFNFDDFENLILIKPDFGVSTAKAYEALNNHCKERSDAVISATIDSKPYFNSFEAVVYEEAPSLLDIHEAMRSEAADQVLLSGSGSTMLAFYKDYSKCQAAFNSLKEKMPKSYFVYQTILLRHYED
jgi:4-diphosphocytidyl-2-C-methyl-D-erythritol kinase